MHLHRSVCTIVILVALSLWPATRAAAEAESSSDDVPRDADALHERIASIVDEHAAPAAGVAVVEGDEVTLADGFGVADRAENRSADARTPFRLGSISKSFVGLSVLHLVERDELDLRAEIARVGPELPVENPYTDEDPVRLVHVLEHTAGFEDMGLATIATSRPDLSPLDAVTLGGEPWRARWRPGTHWAYSNIGPTMAAHIVQKTAGQPFDAFTQRTLFQPLGLESATWRPNQTEREQIATGYRTDGETPVPYRHLAVWPAGSLSMSPEDLGTFVRLMVGRGAIDDQRLVREDAVRRMEQPRTTLAADRGVRVGYGLGVATHASDGYLVRGHDGGMIGHKASYRYIPGEAGFAFSINATDAEAYDALKSLLVDYITQKADKPEPTPVADCPTRSSTRTPATTWWAPSATTGPPRSQGSAGFNPPLGPSAA